MNRYVAPLHAVATGRLRRERIRGSIYAVRIFFRIRSSFSHTKMNGHAAQPTERAGHLVIGLPACTPPPLPTPRPSLAGFDTCPVADRGMGGEGPNRWLWSLPCPPPRGHSVQWAQTPLLPSPQTPRASAPASASRRRSVCPPPHPHSLHTLPVGWRVFRGIVVPICFCAVPV